MYDNTVEILCIKRRGSAGGGAFKKRLIGSESYRVEHVWAQMWKKTHYAGRGGTASFAIAAVGTG